MRIAIVDDIAAERSILHKWVQSCLDSRRIDADIAEYESGETFLSAAEQNRFDLVFLDIYMEGINGIETAAALRRFDTDCLIVFTTTSTDHALEGFRVRAMHYLVKPYDAEDVTALFDEVVLRLSKTEKYVEIVTAKNTVRLRYKEILYAENFQHKVYIYTTSGEVQTRQTFREFVAALTDERFFSCSQGVIVNMEHAADFDGTSFVMNDGKKLPVTRRLIKDAKQAFVDMLFRKGDA